jgi:hypothetical protein
MTRIGRIIADKTKKVSVNPLYQRHPRSIDTFLCRKRQLPIRMINREPI